MDNFLREKIFNSQQVVENAFRTRVGSRSPGFCAKDIIELPLHWQKCINALETDF